MVASPDFADYLKSIIERYEKWWTVDALTETIADRQATFTFEQRAQTEEICKEAPNRKKKISLPLFQIVYEYAKKEHVLLVGSPGIGKSTTLRRLLVDFARQELEKPIPRIPVLIRLKRYEKPASGSEDRSGMLALIQDALEPNLPLEISAIAKLLFQEKRLILLLDGLNEMRADTELTELTAFRDKCDRAGIPLICTTRELGDTLGIKRRLEIQPLMPQGEIQRFLDECMLFKKQEVLQLLDRDTRELSRTPFVLWMLYDSFQQTGDVAGTMGDAFRKFFQSFRGRKEDAPVSGERRIQWDRWLEHLAFSMLNSPDPRDPGLVIPEEQAEKILTAKFGAESPSRINELMKHHLVQEVSHQEIGFHHQLIQEYYAAEALLLKLNPRHSEALTDEQLKQNYLNYRKWTEAIALMLGLVEDEKQALRVVKLAIEVDLMLGARLAGDVKSDFQQLTLSVLSALEISTLLKIRLLGSTHSDSAISLLALALADRDSAVRCTAVNALGQIGSQEAASCLLKVLEGKDSMIYGTAAYWLGKIGGKNAVDALLKDMNHEKSDFRKQAAEALGEINNNKDVIFALCNALNDKEVRLHASLSLKKIKSHIEVSIPCQDLVDEALAKYQTSKNIDPKPPSTVDKTTKKIAPEVSIPILLQQLEHGNSERYTGASIQLKRIGTPEILSRLYSFLPTNKELAPLYLRHILDPIASIQSRCQFYNYEIYKQSQEAENLKSEDDDFITKFYKDLDKAAYKIQENPELRKADSEDRITIDIVNLLCRSGYNASHDSKIGGHVDLAVRKDCFLWLGEAKIYRGTNYLWEGFQQLATRYSIGESNQNNGGLLIYIREEDASSIMEKWRNCLFEKNLPNYTCKPCEMRSLSFVSTHRHEKSGQPFHVRHIPVMLHFAPKDKSGRSRKESS